MKRNTMKLLSLALALVMLLGAVPFASAATPAATIEVSGMTTVWEGTEVDLGLRPASGYSFASVKWLHDNSLSEDVTVAPTVDTTYSVEYKYQNETTTQTASVAIDVLQKAKKATFAINETTAIVGEELTLTVSGKGDSNVTFSGEGVSNGKLLATDPGKYTVTAVAANDPATDSDDVTVTKEITASVATYKVTMSDKTISIADKDEKLTYTAKKGSETVTGTPKFEITSGTNYVTVNQTTGLLTPKAEGTAAAKVTVTFTDGTNTYTATDTATVTVSASGVVYLEQDGEATDDDSIDLEFSVVGPGKKEEVTWEFSVSALNIKSSTDKSSPYFTWKDSKETDKRKYEAEEDGPEFETELVAKKGYGIALIEANAYWTNSRTPDATGTFYVSFYDEVDFEVTLKDDVDEFDWDDDDVFSAAKGTKTYSATELKTLNLAEMLTLDAGTYIDLDEGKDANDNEDVGEITAGSKLADWDPDEVNTYEMEDLEYLAFEVEDEGTFCLDYVQYDKVVGYGSDLIIGEGTIEINVGEGSGKGKKGDINYDVKNKGDVELDEDDFEDFWDEYCDDEDIKGDDAEFGYVIFDYKATKINGTLYGEGGDKSVKNTYMYHFDYDEDDDDGSKDFDLNDMVYEASTSKTNYVDEIDFTCYSENGDEEVDGTLTFTVGEGEKEEEETTIGTMSFSDVKSADWYYDAVKYVYENGIMAGTSTTKFSPDTNLTRGMIVTMLYRVEDQPTVTATNKFTDVKSGDYYYDAVRWAAQNGIVTGTSSTTFSPNTNITRQDLATILYRYVKEYKGQTASLGTLTGFADASQVSDYASSAMKWAVGKGIVNGVAGSLLPKGNATRAQAATMFQRLLAN